MKKAYQLIYNTFDEKFDRTPFYNFMDKELNANHVFPKVYWFESELTPKEISEMITPFMCNEGRFVDTWYIMELSPNMDCWMGISHINWLKERLDFDN